MKLKSLLITLVVAAIVTGGLLRRYLGRMDRANKMYHFCDVIAGVYMPTERRSTGRWPNNLARMPYYLSWKAIDWGDSAGIAWCYRNEYVKFEMLENGVRECRFRLYCKDGIATCESAVGRDVSQDGGSCHADSGF